MNATTDSRGIFYGLSRNGIRDCIDGTSNTAFISETIIRGSTGSSWGEAGGYWGGGRGGGYGFITLEPPNTTLPDRVYQCKSTTFPRSPCTSLTSYSTTSNFARSYHTGGVQLAMADGSVRFASENIDRATWQAVGTRMSNEVIGEW